MPVVPIPCNIVEPDSPRSDINVGLPSHVATDQLGPAVIEIARGNSPAIVCHAVVGGFVAIGEPATDGTRAVGLTPPSSFGPLAVLPAPVYESPENL